MTPTQKEEPKTITLEFRKGKDGVAADLLLRRYPETLHGEWSKQEVDQFTDRYTIKLINRSLSTA